ARRLALRRAPRRQRPLRSTESVLGIRSLLACSGPPADPIDDVVGQRHDIEVSVRALLDARRDAKAPSDDERLALGRVELGRAEEVVGDLVGQPWIGADVHVQTVGGETEAVEAAAGSVDLLETQR